MSSSADPELRMPEPSPPGAAIPIGRGAGASAGAGGERRVRERRRHAGGAPTGRSLEPALAVEVAVARALVEERARVEAFLHDGVLQVLELIAAGAYEDPPDPARLQALAAQAATELRDELSRPESAGGDSLAAELLRVIARERGRGALPVRLEVGRVDEFAATGMVRELAEAVGEALRNASKHSGATLVTVRYEVIDAVAVVVITDDGGGFDGLAHPLGLGLSRSVIGRLRRAGGWARVASSPGAGTEIRLELPLGSPEPPLLAAA